MLSISPGYVGEILQYCRTSTARQSVDVAVGFNREMQQRIMAYQTNVVRESSVDIYSEANDEGRVFVASVLRAVSELWSKQK